jgi:hypothetical protein
MRLGCLTAIATAGLPNPGVVPGFIWAERLFVLGLAAEQGRVSLATNRINRPLEFLCHPILSKVVFPLRAWKKQTGPRLIMT